MIILNDVRYAVADRPILKGMTATLHERRIGIVGRNGSGKSTLLRLMAGLLSLTQGTITVSGVDPARDRKTIISRLGILFQNPDHQILFPTVEEELGFGLAQLGRGKADTKQAVETLLAAEGRSHWAKAATSALSQGQRQYLNLLSILLMEPETILLDEPFSGLDLPTQLRLTRRLASLPQRLITVTHDPAAVCGCDRVLWLEDGRIHRDGPGADVTEAFRRRMIELGEQHADVDFSS